MGISLKEPLRKYSEYSKKNIPFKITPRLSELNTDVRNSVCIGDKGKVYYLINYIVLQ